MIKIDIDDLIVELSYFNSNVVLTRKGYDVFKDNLFVEYNGKKQQIEPNELTILDFNLIWYKHRPNYSNPSQRKLDVEHLLSVCNWTSEKIYE